MNGAIRDIILSAIKPYLKDLNIIVSHNNKILENENINVVITLGEQTRVFKLDQLIKDIQNGKIEIT